MSNMKKKLRIFLIISSILVYSIESFSAISVADGSSFVTKAEFSTDLNSMSNQISRMENSLDNKIDSLVSAYLNRNGIWNGAKQLTAATSLSSISYARLVEGQFSSVYNLIAGNTNETTSYTIKNDVTKSGMAVITIKSNSNGYITTQQRQDGAAQINGQNIDQYIKGSGAILFNIFVYSASTKVKTRVFSNKVANTFAHLYTLRNDTFYISRNTGWDNSVFVAVFFLSKGDNVSYNYISQNSFYAVGKFYTSSQPEKSGGSFQFTVMDFNIY